MVGGNHLSLSSCMLELNGDWTEISIQNESGCCLPELGNGGVVSGN